MGFEESGLENTLGEKVFALPLYERWAQITQESIQRRKRLERKWTKFYRDYRGQQLVMDSDDEIIVNVTYGHARVAESVLYYEDPYFRVRPRRDIMLAPKAQLIEELLNTSWYAMRIGNQVKQAIIDAWLLGWASILVGHSDYHEPNLLQKKGGVYVKRMNPLDLYPEDDVESFSQATYWIRRTMHSTRWLEKVFKKKDWLPDLDNSVFQRRVLGTKNTTQATLYEIIDLVDNQMTIISPQHKEVIWKNKYPYPYFEAPPYVTLVFVEDPERLYPISPNGIVEYQQDELNRIRTQQMRHRKRFNRRYLMQEGSIEADEIQKIEAGEDGVIAKCKADPNTCLTPIQDAPLDPQMTQMYQQDIKSDMREILGINEYLRAGMISRTKSASEANMIQEGSNIRTRNLAKPVHDFIVDIARRMILVFQNEYDDINYLIKPDAQGQLREQMWTKENIAGDFDVEIELGSILPPAPIPYEVLSQQSQQGAVPTGPAPSGMPTLGAEGQ